MITLTATGLHLAFMALAVMGCIAAYMFPIGRNLRGGDFTAEIGTALGSPVFGHVLQTLAGVTALVIAGVIGWHLPLLAERLGSAPLSGIGGGVAGEQDMLSLTARLARVVGALALTLIAAQILRALIDAALMLILLGLAGLAAMYVLTGQGVTDLIQAVGAAAPAAG